ncbi:unnamed protein product [Arabidopsis thaliana]|uniref:(thale cress) hypothetical protein n=1 Tax=Arabidopsis thaliana TaxID=3702 RepID=A0A7G2E2R8_ARATH|nr:unnamed protein product [Arabidopsis thaliana]
MPAQHLDAYNCRTTRQREMSWISSIQTKLRDKFGGYCRGAY